MEKNFLENKMRDVKESLEQVNKNLGLAIKPLDDKLRKDMGAKWYARYEAFRGKYISLTSQGKMKEAEDLKKEFENG